MLWNMTSSGIMVRVVLPVIDRDIWRSPCLCCWHCYDSCQCGIRQWHEFISPHLEIMHHYVHVCYLFVIITLQCIATKQLSSSFLHRIRIRCVYYVKYNCSRGKKLYHIIDITDVITAAELLGWASQVYHLTLIEG